MEYNIHVKESGKVIYPIILTNDYNKLGQVLTDLKTTNKKICIVSDSNVSKLYSDEIFNIVKNHTKETYTFDFPAGELHKNLDTVYSLYEKLIQWKFDRKDILIALGGGVVGDLTGYVAATYLRGISFVQIPTSLLAMVDSSIGGKTGVDFKGYKNMVGAFHQPSAVYINVKSLESLPKEHYYNGMAEIIKHGLIMDSDYFKWLRGHEKEIHSFEHETIMQMIYRSCLIKKEVVENDPKEQGIRAILNFGHTIGHAIEKAMDFKLLHGECVSIGIAGASYISLKQGYLCKDDLVEINNLLKDFKLPVSISDSISYLDSRDVELSESKYLESQGLLSSRNGISMEEVLDNISLDKKQESGKLKFILLKEIGQAFIETNVSNAEIIEAIKYILI